MRSWGESGGVVVRGVVAALAQLSALPRSSPVSLACCVTLAAMALRVRDWEEPLALLGASRCACSLGSSGCVA